MPDMTEDVKKKPVPFSAEPAFVEFMDEMAGVQSTSRSGLTRLALKEFAKRNYPNIFAKHFPNEVTAMQPPGEYVSGYVAPVTTPFEPPKVGRLVKPPIQDEVEDDFLDNIEAAGDEPTEEGFYGAPDQCPDCRVPREQHGKTNVICSTNPERGRWICNECSASGEYFPDQPPTVN